MTQFPDQRDGPRPRDHAPSLSGPGSIHARGHVPGRALPLLLAVFLVLLALGACSRISNPEGWSGVAVTEDALFIGTREGDLLALNRETGEGLWRFTLNDTNGEPVGQRERAIYTTPVVVDGTIYFGGYDGSFYALNLESDIVWRAGVGGPIVGTPAVADGKIVFGSSDGNLYAYDLLEDTELWRFRTEGKIWSEPAVSNRLVFFGSLDKNVYAVRLDDGTEAWRFETGGAVAGSPIIVGNHVLIGSFDSTFYALHAATGQEVWRFEGARSWYWARPVVAQRTVYVPSLDSNLYALDIDTGEVRWTLQTKDPIIGAPVVVGNVLVVPSRDVETKIWQLALVGLNDGVKIGACNIDEEIRTPLVSDGDMVYFGARDRSIRAVRVKDERNIDEEWVHFTDRDDPLPRGRPPTC